MKFLSFLVTLFVGMILANCLLNVGHHNPTDPPIPSAFLFQSTKSSVKCDNYGAQGCAATVGPKTGEACAQQVLYLVQWGDNSLKAAAIKGNVTKIDHIDYSMMSVLGSVYAKKCLIVNGQ